MADEIITLSKIHDIFFDEKENKELIALPKNIYSQFRNYISLKEKQIQNSDDTYKKLELEQTKNVIKNIYHLRERKLVNLALFSYKTGEEIETDDFSALEKEFFDVLMQIFQRYKSLIHDGKDLKDIPKGVITKKEEKEKEIKEPEIDVIFVRNVPAFKYKSKKFGPFKKGESSKVPQGLENKLSKMKMIDSSK